MLDSNRREFIALVGGGGLLLAAKVKRARGQQPAMPVIGFLRSTTASGFEHLETALRHGLDEEGFVEGRNVVIEYRYADNQRDRLPALVDDLIRRSVAVIVGNHNAALAAKAATTAVPIVVVTGGPTRSGTISSPASTGRART